MDTYLIPDRFIDREKGTLNRTLRVERDKQPSKVYFEEDIKIAKQMNADNRKLLTSMELEAIAARYGKRETVRYIGARGSHDKLFCEVKAGDGAVLSVTINSTEQHPESQKNVSFAERAYQAGLLGFTAIEDWPRNTDLAARLRDEGILGPEESNLVSYIVTYRADRLLLPEMSNTGIDYSKKVSEHMLDFLAAFLAYQKPLDGVEQIGAEQIVSFAKFILDVDIHYLEKRLDSHFTDEQRKALMDDLQEYRNQIAFGYTRPFDITDQPYCAVKFILLDADISNLAAFTPQGGKVSSEAQIVILKDGMRPEYERRFWPPVLAQKHNFGPHLSMEEYMLAKLLHNIELNYSAIIAPSARQNIERALVNFTATNTLRNYSRQATPTLELARFIGNIAEITTDLQHIIYRSQSLDRVTRNIRQHILRIC